MKERIEGAIRVKEYLLEVSLKDIESAKKDIKRVSDGFEIGIVTFMDGYVANLRKALDRVNRLTEELQELKFILGEVVE